MKIEGACQPLPRWIGQSFERVEDERILLGKGCFIDDMLPSGCVHAVFVRSSMARARILLNANPAREQPGVLAVVIGADVAALGSLAVNRILSEMHVPVRPILARDVVNAVGEPLAMVLAETLDAARDAMELVEVEYESIPPVLDAARAAEEQRLFEDLPTNEAFAHRWRVGDMDAAFAGADHTVTLEIEFPRVAPSPLEPRGMLASWDDPKSELTVWTSSQTPHRARADIARILGLDAARVHAISPDVGGAFGMKASIYPEDALVAWASMKLRRPVKWVATRSEDLLSATQGRGGMVKASLALRAGGALLGLRARVTCPLGAWLPYSAAVPAWNAARILPGPYRVEAVDIGLQGVVTNTAPIGIYRGAGRPEAAVVMERLMDEVARVLGMDPAEVRRRNLIPKERFPYRTPTDQVLDSGDYGYLLRRALELVEYSALRDEQARRRKAGALYGVGVALYVEPCGQGSESARVTVRRDGSVIAASGSSAQGQGHRTVFAQIVAEYLGVDAGAVEVRGGDTRLTPTGTGALASRSTAIGGSALKLAAEEVRERGRKIAVRLLNASLEEVSAGAGGFQVAAAPARSVDWQTVAKEAGHPHDQASPNESALDATVVYTAPAEAWSSGCCVAAVSIDTDTGEVRIERFVWVDDAGLIINPLLANGQLVGGFAQGVGQAFMEQIRYDETGQLLTGTLIDYALPRAEDIPAVTIEKLATTSPANALGAKGIGESGCIGVPPALINAVIDALAPHGVHHLDMPLTSEKIWKALHTAEVHQESSR